MADYSELISEYCVYAVDPPCDCDYEEIFGADHARSDELWSAVPIEDAQEMIQRANVIALTDLLDELKENYEVVSESNRGGRLIGQQQALSSVMQLVRNHILENK